MLGFLSFVVVMALLFGTVGLIVTTIRGASGAIRGALRGDARDRESFVNFRPRAIRQMRPASPYYAPLRAAA